MPADEHFHFSHCDSPELLIRARSLNELEEKRPREVRVVVNDVEEQALRVVTLLPSVRKPARTGLRLSSPSLGEVRRNEPLPFAPRQRARSRGRTSFA